MSVATATVSSLATPAACPPGTARVLFHRLAEAGRRRRDLKRLQALELTPRQIEVLVLLTHGCSNREIAHQLHLSPHTVKAHVRGVLAKLGAKSRDEAVCRAYSRRWLIDRRSRPHSVS